MPERTPQGVLAADRVFDVENNADLPTDGFTVIDEDAFGAVDIDAQHRMTTLGNELDAPALIAERSTTGPARPATVLACSTPDRLAYVVETKMGETPIPKLPLGTVAWTVQLTKKPPKKGALKNWLRGLDLNQRPSG